MGLFNCLMFLFLFLASCCCCSSSCLLYRIVYKLLKIAHIFQFWFSACSLCVCVCASLCLRMFSSLFGVLSLVSIKVYIGRHVCVCVYLSVSVCVCANLQANTRYTFINLPFNMFTLLSIQLIFVFFLLYPLLLCSFVCFLFLFNTVRELP